MIDIHCHLLPAIDDGPKLMDDALQLAKQAVADGVTHAVVTPHIHHGRWENTISGISQAVSNMREVLADESVPLALGFAGEIRIGTEILSMLPRNEIPFLGSWEGRQVMLLEMPHSHILPGTKKIVEWMLARNVLPMIAHPERNKDVMRSPDKLKPLIELGCLFQLTAGSLVGQFGEAAKDVAEDLLSAGVVTVLASDAHHISRRPVNLMAGRRAAEKVIGEQEATKLVYDNPLKIVRAQFMVEGSEA